MCATNRGIAAAVVVSAALAHYYFGFSPISKSYEPIAASGVLQQPDPRMKTVRELRGKIPKHRTILATERMAAHFTDYRRIYTGKRVRPTDFVILDRSDHWDTTGLPRRADEFARDPDYGLYGEYASIIVFERRSRAPEVPD